MTTPLRLLILEDKSTDAELMMLELQNAGFAPEGQRVGTEQDYLAHLDANLDVILADYALPQFDALRALQLLQAQDYHIPFIVVTGNVSEEIAVECIKRGASDYLLKDRLARLGPAVMQALERKRSDQEMRRRLQELTAIHKAGQRLQKLQSPQELAQEIIQVLEDTLNYEQGAVLLIDQASGKLIPFAVSDQGMGPNFVKLDKAYILSRGAQLGVSITGWVAQTGQSACVGDVRQDPRYQAVRPNILSELCVPLRAGDRVIGVVNVETTRLNAYTESDQRVLETVAAQIATAIQNAHLFDEVSAAREGLKKLSTRILSAQEDERRRLARELHDEIGQALTAVKINLLGMQHVPVATALAPYIDDSVATVERALQQVRNLSLDLRPSLLDDLGLVAALRWYVDRQAQRAGFVGKFITNPLDPRPASEIETACFRIVQEALTNVARHAQAQHVRVELRASDSELRLVVRDDGIGFDVPAARERAAHGASLGLLGMEERAHLVGGQIEIESAPGRGAEIRVRLPLHAPRTT